MLTFDFRGNGLSGGAIVLFGDRTCCQVTCSGAVKWLRENQPPEGASRRIVVLGIDTGRSGTDAAAADRFDEGRAVKRAGGVRMLRLVQDLAASVAAISFPPPLQWLIVPWRCRLMRVPRICGISLRRTLVGDVVWRPILFIHGRRDPVIAFERGVSLYDAASAPKAHIWLDDSTDDEAINDPSVVNRIRHFLNTAVPML